VDQNLPSFKESTVMQKIIFIIAIVFSLVSLYFGFSPEASVLQQAIHLMFASAIIFLLSKPAIKAVKVFDILVMICTTFSAMYLILNFEAISWRAGDLNTLDLTMGAITIFSVLYATKKIIGWSLPIIAIVFILYALFGRYFPGMFQHGGYDISRIIGHIYLTEDGIYGSPLKASATLVIFFLIFSSFYERAGGGNLVIQLANAMFGWLRGGPAKVAVVASSLFGSISGSAVANVVGTGALTIPLMKKTGYNAHFAGAVEAVSSTGGQIMPPIMGAAAFIMAEMLGIPYSEIVIAAIIPAILYYLALFIMVHYEAKRLGLQKVDKSTLPSTKQVLIDSGHMLVPLFVLVYLLVFLHYSPARAALITLGVILIFSMLRKGTRLGINGFFESLRNGSLGVLQVALACACAGIIVGIFSLTGLGLKMSHILINLSGGSMVILLILTALTSIILGMGMPTVGAYLVLAILIAPTLIDAGFNPVAAHLFIFYFGNISNVTPPVALAAYAAAGLAGSNASKTGWTATRLAVSGFIIPFMFIFNEELLLEGSTTEIIYIVLTSLIGIAFLSIALQGYFSTNIGLTEKILLIVASIMLINPELITSICGITLGIIVLFWNVTKGKKATATANINL
jgi:TRAP transporter 4TM/12TM fusion protein